MKDKHGCKGKASCKSKGSCGHTQSKTAKRAGCGPKKGK